MPFLYIPYVTFLAFLIIGNYACALVHGDNVPGHV